MGEPRCAPVKMHGEEAVLFPVWRELQFLDDKITRQQMRVQDQNQRLTDMVVQPLDSKMASLETRQKALDGQLAELSGGIRGLQGAMELQVRRSDATETRLQRWWKLLQDDLQVSYSKIREELGETTMAKVGDSVTRRDLLDVTDLLKQELRRLVAEAVTQSGPAVTQQELAEVASSLRHETQQELATVANSLRHELGMTDKPAMQQELRRVAESVRQELRRLTESCEQGTASSPIRELERAGEAQRKVLAELLDRTTRSEQQVEDTRGDLRRFREELRSKEALGAKALTRTDVERIAERVCSEGLLQQRRSSGPDGDEVGFMLRALEEKVKEGAAKVEQLMGEARAERQLGETLTVVMETTTMRLNSMEERQRGLYEQQCTTDLEARLDSAWQLIQEQSLGRPMELQRAEQLAQRMADLEKAKLGEQLQGVARRLGELEASSTAGSALAARGDRLEERVAELEQAIPSQQLVRRLETLEEQTTALGDGLVQRVAELELGAPGRQLPGPRAATGRPAAPPNSGGPGGPEAALSEAALLARCLVRDLGDAAAVAGEEAGGPLAVGAAEAPEAWLPPVDDLPGQIAALWQAVAEMAEFTRTACDAMAASSHRAVACADQQSVVC